MRHDDNAPKHKRIHTVINIGLICFLLLVATVGLQSLTPSSFGSELGNHDIGFTNDQIMVCAIGQCIFV